MEIPYTFKNKKTEKVRIVGVNRSYNVTAKQRINFETEEPVAFEKNVFSMKAGISQFPDVTLAIEGVHEEDLGQGDNANCAGM